LSLGHVYRFLFIYLFIYLFTEEEKSSGGSTAPGVATMPRRNASSAGSKKDKKEKSNQERQGRFRQFIKSFAVRHGSFAMML